MTHSAVVALALALLALPAGAYRSVAQPSPYAATQTGDVVTLEDRAAQARVSLLPSVGNVTFEFVVKGQNVLNFTGGPIETFKGGLTGIPFVAPFMSRLDEPAFYANGRRYAFDMQLGNIRGATPIHGFLTPSAQSPVHWQLVELKADSGSAWATSRLEFYRNPLWMKQFPFAHTIEMTHRLQNGALSITTTLDNLSVEPMPVAIGFHPYFRLTDSTRDEWVISIAAKTHWPLTAAKLPTGETEPIERVFPNPGAIPLKDYDLDDVFSDLVRDESGRATMTVRGPKSQQIDVTFGRNYRSAVVWAPKPTPNAAGQVQPREFVCFEPLAGIANSMNLAQRGQYKELQSVPPGGVWEASFTVHPKGF